MHEKTLNTSNDKTDVARMMDYKEDIDSQYRITWRENKLGSCYIWTAVDYHTFLTEWLQYTKYWGTKITVIHRLIADIFSSAPFKKNHETIFLCLLDMADIVFLTGFKARCNLLPAGLKGTSGDHLVELPC